MPPACEPGDFFPALDHRGCAIVWKPTADAPSGGYYRSSKEEATWEVESGTCSQVGRTEACPVGPVPDCHAPGRHTKMSVVLWRRALRPVELKERDKVVKLRKEVPFSAAPFETQTIASLTQLANYQHLESSLLTLKCFLRRGPAISKKS